RAGDAIRVRAVEARAIELLGRGRDEAIASLRRRATPGTWHREAPGCAARTSSPRHARCCTTVASPVTMVIDISLMERWLTIDGARLAVDDDGTGDPVVCLHAIGHDARDFDGVRAHLRDRHRVIALDWPGQGRSPRDGRPVTATRYAELVQAVLDALDVETCVVIGNSIGGAAAIAYAARHAERVRGLVLENPGGLAPVDDRLAQAVLAAMARFFAAGARGAARCERPGHASSAVRTRRRPCSSRRGAGSRTPRPTCGAWRRESAAPCSSRGRPAISSSRWRGACRP